MTMMNVSFFYCQIMIGPWFIFERNHGCGPIPDGKSGWDPVMASMSDTIFLSKIYFSFSFTIKK